MSAASNAFLFLSCLFQCRETSQTSCSYSYVIICMEAFKMSVLYVVNKSSPLKHIFKPRISSCYLPPKASKSRMRSELPYLCLVARLGEAGRLRKHQSCRLTLEPRPGFSPPWTSHFPQRAAPRAIISLNSHANILDAAPPHRSQR